jgi:hypothetical protein
MQFIMKHVNRSNSCGESNTGGSDSFRYGGQPGTSCAWTESVSVAQAGQKLGPARRIARFTTCAQTTIRASFLSVDRQTGSQGEDLTKFRFADKYAQSGSFKISAGVASNNYNQFNTL